MEGLDQKLERVSGDINNLIELYDFAEKVYGYDKIRDTMKVSLEEVKRIRNTKKSYKKFE
jgi:hypothetical protein